MEMFSENELLSFNEKLLGRGMPIQQDGTGYNKADYGICANYYYGLSNGQLADLANRLVKYSTTQLRVDKDAMKHTANSLLEKSSDEDRNYGVSVNVVNNVTEIHFRYNNTFIKCLKDTKMCKYNSDKKVWTVANNNLLDVLKTLKGVGANVDNAISYAKCLEYTDIKENAIIEENVDKIIKIIVKSDEDIALLKFNYNENLLEEIKKIDSSERCWNKQFKFWAIKLNHLGNILNNVSDEFKVEYVS